MAIGVGLDDGQNIAGTQEAPSSLLEIVEKAAEINPGEGGR
jgi:hypothetical protein